jgi:hypothetical protein
LYTRAMKRLLIANGHKVEREVAVMALLRKRASIGFCENRFKHRNQPVSVVAVAVPLQSTVQLPFPENGASVTSISLPTLDRRVPMSLTAKCGSECDAA